MKTNMKRVFLFAPDWVDFISCFEKNLKFCGFHVSTPNQEVPPFRYRSFGQRACNFLRKTFLRDHTYKEQLKEKHFLQHRFPISGSQQYDYALIVRADLLSLKELEFIKKTASKMICFHFDGMNRYPEIFSRIKFFDQCFVFDVTDIQKYPLLNLTPITNFYFDYPIASPFKHIKQTGYDFYYLGTYHRERIQTLLEMQRFFSRYEFSHKIELVFPQSDFSKITPALANRVTCMTEMIPFEDYLIRMQRSSVILDFVLPEHTGLSFRVFESIYYDKKLITTNKNVIDYEFYHPDNIFILDQNYEDLFYFLSRPYQKLPLPVKKKYGFTNWIRNIFKEGPFEKITVPNHSQNEIGKHYHSLLQ